MVNKLIIGFNKKLMALPIPLFLIQGLVKVLAKKESKPRLACMSEDHHRIRDFVVKKISQTGKSISPEHLSREFNIPIAGVTNILEELERELVFLFRNEKGEVTWAYPVTADKTPHKIIFNTGEEVNAA